MSSTWWIWRSPQLQHPMAWRIRISTDCSTMDKPVICTLLGYPRPFLNKSSLTEMLRAGCRLCHDRNRTFIARIVYEHATFLTSV